MFKPGVAAVAIEQRLIAVAQRDPAGPSRIASPAA
jgi:hypothetical protein